MIEKMIPSEYQRLKTLPGDREGTLVYATQTSEAMCFLKAFPIADREVMPRNGIAKIVKGIHECLEDDQGLIEVATQPFGSGDGYIVYSIIKSRSSGDASGITYTLRLHAVGAETWECVGFFQETGMTGMRDATIFEIMFSQNLVKLDMSDWRMDPFDDTRKNGLLMNMSEQARFDPMFPDSVLTRCRVLVQHVINSL